MKTHFQSIRPLALSLTLAASALTQAKEISLASPDGRLLVVVSDTDGLKYRVEMDGQPLLAESQLGLAFADGLTIGSTSQITGTRRQSHNGFWENRYGASRVVPDNWCELKLEFTETNDSTDRPFGLTVRAYDNGVAFRYDLPESFSDSEFILNQELTEFRFPADYRCWAGGEHSSAENQYPETTLSAIPTQNNKGGPYHGVLPLLVETPSAYVAIAESDLLDWAGMLISGTGETAAKVTLAQRHDGRGAVVGPGPMQSPWRALLVARNASELLTNDLVATLATPSRVDDESWNKPGVSAWDTWWTGVNPTQPENTGVYSRGDNRSHKEYIDFAAEMGFRYQLMDWFWYEHMTIWDKGLNSEPNAASGDFTQELPHIDVPELVSYASERDVDLWIWAHSLDIKTFGMERALEHFADLGVVGIKVDFFGSDSQETVQWIVELLERSARHHLMVDLQGVYKPTGLARTYPNYLTQEGVLGNEYNKLGGNQCDPLHTITLPFTRGLLGPMDFTPGGFLNRTPPEFEITHPAQVMGSRARQLAMTVIYLSPFQVLCDSPANYRDQPGVDFFRDLPTVWDETVILSAEVAGHVVIARRSGSQWRLAAMNGEEPMTLKVPLTFLGEGEWSLKAFADKPESGEQPESISESTRTVEAIDTLTLSLSPAGGYASILTQP
ncbi:glycoside hydrolase family 97 protein [Pelagicoccus sp. SDUM812003]|uniref:glycoside hydrolase family 97 protein n=1 Tax=Pelagicoccus sp. SDUM812003 TaxID=3041267 RepID=UPI00280FC040|nr:glycoside hydrolase family 97 protein [Pelagicoccus sp. SDUM812003]MDQ8202152.1 glycoside hydrolase family 97 protein [Pelagicoccus sp. SDUM812003]